MSIRDWFVDRHSLVAQLANLEQQLRASAAGFAEQYAILRKELERERAAHRETRRKLDHARTGHVGVARYPRAARTPQQPAPTRSFDELADAIDWDADMTRRDDGAED